jgi:hypothetical protein
MKTLPWSPFSQLLPYFLHVLSRMPVFSIDQRLINIVVAKVNYDKSKYITILAKEFYLQNSILWFLTSASNQGFRTYLLNTCHISRLGDL